MTASKTATKTATKEPATASEAINDLFHEAMLEYEKALKSGIQFQEDAAKLWRDLLAKAGTPTALQTALESASAELFPTAHKRVSEFVEACSVNLMLANRARSQAAELFGKTLGIYQSSSIAEAQTRAQDVIESALSIARGNIHTILNINTKFMDACKNLTNLFPARSFAAVAQAFAEAPAGAA